MTALVRFEKHILSLLIFGIGRYSLSVYYSVSVHWLCHVYIAEPKKKGLLWNESGWYTRCNRQTIYTWSISPTTVINHLDWAPLDKMDFIKIIIPQGVSEASQCGTWKHRQETVYHRYRIQRTYATAKDNAVHGQNAFSRCIYAH